MSETRDYYSIIFVHGYLILLFIVGALDVGLFQTGSAKPAFFLIGLYSALLFRSDITPQWSVFLYGFAYDCIYGTPLGTYIFIMLAMTLLIDNGRRYLQGQSWPVIWSGFILTYAAILILEIIIFGILHGAALDGPGMAGRLFMSSIGFPIIFMPFIWMDRWQKHHD